MIDWHDDIPRPVMRRRKRPETNPAVKYVPECPKWVPLHLIKEWKKIALAKDEYAAAAHVRALKKRDGL